MKQTQNETQRARLIQLLANPKEMERGFQEMVQQALCHHKEIGNSIAAWEDGRVVIVPAEDIILSPDMKTEDLQRERQPVIPKSC